MPNKSSAIGTYSDISEAASFDMAVLTIAVAIALVAVSDHARLMIDPWVFLHQPEDDMIQLVIGLSEFSLDLPKTALDALQCSYVFR